MTVLDRQIVQFLYHCTTMIRQRVLKPIQPAMQSLALLLLASVVCAAQVSKDPKQINAGHVTFILFCSPCHGMHATGGRGPDLTLGTYQNGDSDDDLFRVISHGVTSSQMPPFGADLSPDSIWQVVSFLRSITQPPSEKPVHGDEAAGKKLFWGEGGCGQCHMVGDRGGRLGPDLTKIGRERSLAYLRQSIVAPDADIPPGYETATIVTQDGQTITGVAKRFDDFSVEIMDASQKLYSFSRSKLRSAKLEHHSLMPPAYGQLFSPTDLDNLLTYLVSLRGGPLSTPVTPIDTSTLSDKQLLDAQNDPGTWLMYGRNYAGWRYSPLAQINTSNVAELRPQWIFQAADATEDGRMETTPLVDNGIMWLTGSSNHAYAVDLRSGLQLWQYHESSPPGLQLCCGEENRGFAMLGNRLFKVNIEGDLVALDALTGRVVWKTNMSDYKKGYSATAAPLIVKNMVLVGSAGADFGVRGFVDAYDAQTGKRLWRFYAVPKPGQPGSDTWPGVTAWIHGGGATWVTGTYDPELNLVYWGTGNPGPDMDGSVRLGDNLYTCSLVALDPDTGKMKWYFQFTPHDTHDWDAIGDPVLIDMSFHGRPVKAVIQANRNGFFYALDRTNGKFLLASKYTTVSWAKGIDSSGRPIKIPGQDPTDDGNRACPGLGGGHNWEPTAYSPQTRLYYFTSTDGCQIFYKTSQDYQKGRRFQAGTVDEIEKAQTGSIIAMDPASGVPEWRLKTLHPPSAGILATGGGLVFTGDGAGYIFAMDARTGKILWHLQAGGPVKGEPITYEFQGKQYLAVPAGSDIVTFSLP